MHGWPFIWLGFHVIRSKRCMTYILLHFSCRLCSAMPVRLRTINALLYGDPIKRGSPMLRLARQALQRLLSAAALR